MLDKNGQRKRSETFMGHLYETLCVPQTIYVEAQSWIGGYERSRSVFEGEEKASKLCKRGCPFLSW